MKTSEEIILIDNREIGVDELCDSHTAAKIIGFKNDTVRRMAVRGDFPAYRFGKSVRFLVRDLLEFTEQRRI